MSWPPMVSNITTPLLGLVDTAVVGHLADASHLGAVAIGATVFSFVFWAFGFLRMGSTGLTAQAWGRNDLERVRELLYQSVLMALVLGLLLIVLRQPIIDLALYFIDPSDEVAPFARLYCEIRIFSAPAVLSTYALIGWFYGVQQARNPLWIMLMINIANMLLDVIAVYGLHMTSDGVALATVLADYLGFTLALYLAYRKMHGLTAKKSIKMGRFDVKKLTSLTRYMALVQVNRHLFVRTILLLSVSLFFTAQGAQQSDAILAANAVLLIFLMIISNALDGFAFAVEALCGECIGKQDRSAFQQTVWFSTFWALIAACLLVITFWLSGETIIHLLTSIESVQQEAMIYLPWLILLPLLGIWSFMLDGIFIGATATKQMQYSTLFAVLGVFFPCWYLSQQLGLGNHGLWLSQALLFVARAISLYWLYRRNMSTNLWFTNTQ
ncbi:MATE family efflux transporter [Marinomonas agarivorans]|nr:MATE family efflux transporter [Marinomonas agarivorans]